MPQRKGKRATTYRQHPNALSDKQMGHNEWIEQMIAFTQSIGIDIQPLPTVMSLEWIESNDSEEPMEWGEVVTMKSAKKSSWQGETKKKIMFNLLTVTKGCYLKINIA